MKRIKSLADLDKFRREQEGKVQDKPMAIVGMGTCGIAAGAKEILAALKDEVCACNLDVDICQTGCIGMCEQEPLLDVELSGQARVTYGKVTTDLVRKIVREHIGAGRLVEEAALACLTKED